MITNKRNFIAKNKFMLMKKCKVNVKLIKINSH